MLVQYVIETLGSPLQYIDWVGPECASIYAAYGCTSDVPWAVDCSETSVEALHVMSISG